LDIKFNKVKGETSIREREKKTRVGVGERQRGIEDGGRTRDEGKGNFDLRFLRPGSTLSTMLKTGSLTTGFAQDKLHGFGF